MSFNETLMMHGNCLTVTGKTIAENLENIKPEKQTIIAPFENPIKKDSHLKILYGNLRSS